MAQSKYIARTWSSHGPESVNRDRTSSIRRTKHVRDGRDPQTRSCNVKSRLRVSRGLTREHIRNGMTRLTRARKHSRKESEHDQGGHAARSPRGGTREVSRRDPRAHPKAGKPLDSRGCDHTRSIEQRERNRRGLVCRLSSVQLWPCGEKTQSRSAISFGSSPLGTAARELVCSFCPSRFLACSAAAQRDLD